MKSLCNGEYYVSLIMVTITRHIISNIFQTGRFSSMKFAMGYEKKRAFLCYQNCQKFEKKVEKIGLGPFKEFSENRGPTFLKLWKAIL